MGYRYLDDFRRSISVFAIFSYGIGYPPMSPSLVFVHYPNKGVSRLTYGQAQSMKTPVLAIPRPRNITSDIVCLI